MVSATLRRTKSSRRIRTFFLILTPTRGPEARPPTDAHLDDRLAVKYLFLANEGDADRALVLEPFNATNEQNDYEVRSPNTRYAMRAYNYSSEPTDAPRIDPMGTARRHRGRTRCALLRTRDRCVARRVSRVAPQDCDPARPEAQAATDHTAALGVLIDDGRWEPELTRGE